MNVGVVGADGVNVGVNVGVDSDFPSGVFGEEVGGLSVVRVISGVVKSIVRVRFVFDFGGIFCDVSSVTDDSFSIIVW